jgi:hypothetical protein
LTGLLTRLQLCKVIPLLKLSRAPEKYAPLLLVFLLVGCRWEVGKGGDPTPTPSPTPSPTPLVDFGAAADSVSSVEALSAAAQVANASADFFEVTTAQAAEESASAARSLSRALAAPSEASAQLPSTKKSLSKAADAYRRAEASVFLVDPESAAELHAQPDPLGAGAPGGRDESMAELHTALEKMESLLSRPINAETGGLLLAEAQSIAAKIDELEAGLRGMAEAWRDDAVGNFRGKFFLSSPEAAVARLFQGALAMTGDVLPAMLADPEQSEEIAARLSSVMSLYAGITDTEETAPSLQLLVEEVSPVQAALTRASLARAAALAGLLEINPNNQDLRTALEASLEDSTRQLILSAKSLGIVIIDGE